MSNSLVYQLPELPHGHGIKAAKKKDVDELLQAIVGKDWKCDNQFV